MHSGVWTKAAALRLMNILGVIMGLKQTPVWILLRLTIQTQTPPKEEHRDFGISPANNSYVGWVPTNINFAAPTNVNAEFSVECWLYQFINPASGGDRRRRHLARLWQRRRGVCAGYGRQQPVTICDSNSVTPGEPPTAPAALSIPLLSADGTMSSASATRRAEPFTFTSMEPMPESIRFQATAGF